MSSLLSIISSAASSLQGQEAGVATASNNIENANTPGYARQVAVISSAPSDLVAGAFIGGGSQLQSVTQIRDQFVEAQIPAQMGLASSSAAASSALDSITAFDPSTGDGLATSISNFYSSLQALSQNAGDSSLREAVIGSANNLAVSFNTTASQLSDSRSAVDQQISADVTQANALAAQVASLNQQIEQASASAQPNALLDARNSAVEQLAQLTGATPVQTNGGGVSLFMPGGSALVSDSSAGTLSAVADPNNDGLLSIQFTSAGGGPAQAVTNAGGEIGGLMSARDGAMATAQSSIDQLAFDLAGKVNAVQENGYGTDGSTGNPLFDVGTTAKGAAAAFTVDPAIESNPAAIAAASSAATAPGDATNLQAIIATQDATLSSGANALTTLATTTAQLGSAAQDADATSQLDSSMLSQLTTMQQSASGVSTEEELTNLQTYEQGYQAISQVIQASNTLFTTLMNIGSTTTA